MLKMFYPEVTGRNQPTVVTEFQMKNQQYIKSNPEVKKVFKEMQKFAKAKDQLSAFTSAVWMLEKLTGYQELTSWVVGQFDLDF